MNDQLVGLVVWTAHQTLIADEVTLYETTAESNLHALAVFLISRLFERRRQRWVE